MKRILLVWPIHRSDWVAPFRKIHSHFHFHFLSGESLGSESHSVVDFASVTRWSDYSDSYAVIDAVRPDKIVFMSIDTGLNICLNRAAQRYKIKTYILQHGIYTLYKDYRIREKVWNKLIGKSRKVKRGDFNSLRFILESLNGWSDCYVFIRIVILSIMTSRKGSFWANRYFSFKAKQPDSYICYSPRNAEIHRELDRPEENKFLYTGSQELDKYLIKESVTPTGPYYLHIDQALADNSLGEEIISKEQMINFYLKLNDFCLTEGAKLLVKLHPESYKSKWLPREDNIVYLRQVENLNAIIQGAEGCFGFFSTLVIPAVLWKKTILFKLSYSAMQKHLSRLGVVKLYSFWDFDPKSLSFNFNQQNLEEFKKEYFYYLDGNSCERLINILDD